MFGDLKVTGGAANTVPKIREGPALKLIFSALWTSVWPEIRWGN